MEEETTAKDKVANEQGGGEVAGLERSDHTALVSQSACRRRRQRAVEGGRVFDTGSNISKPGRAKQIRKHGIFARAFSRSPQNLGAKMDGEGGLSRLSRSSRGLPASLCGTSYA